MYPCKGVLIDPFACTVTEVELPGPDYKCIYPVLSHISMPVDCFTAAYPEGLRGRDAIFVDDNGLLKPCERFFVIRGYPQELAGKGLVLGADGAGNTISAETKIATIKDRVMFLQHRGGGRFWRTTDPWQADPAETKH